MYLSGDTSIFGVVGNPVSHSFSPAMQTIAFQHCKYNAVYVPFLISQENIPAVINAMKVLNVKGFNVTAPYKNAIIEQLDEVSEEAKVLGSVNVVHCAGGTWKGYNTDGEGFVEGLKEIHFQPAKTTVQIMGAGGAAQSVIYNLAKAKAGKIYIENRTFSKVHSIIKKYAPLFPEVKFIGGICEQSFDLLVNTTSVGWDITSLSAPVELIERASVVSDVIYAKKTALLQKAKELGKTVQNGLPMLLYQGALTFEIWTSQTAPLEVMKNCLHQIFTLEK
jgi:shikimate dehydrogenase